MVQIKPLIISAVVTVTALLMNATPAWGADIHVIPNPVKVTQQRGEFTLPFHVVIAYNTTEGKSIANFLADKLRTSTAHEVTLASKKGTVNILIDPSLKLKEEGYRLNVSKQCVTIKAKTAKGAFYGMQTFLQLLPAEVESMTPVAHVDWVAPCCDIEDYPRFSYRGFHLDPCRHFISVENVKKQLDLMAMFKINTLHFHLTDDQGWRIEIKKYPLLTTVGGTRIEDGNSIYSGYYTQEDIKDIVKYAAERYITVIPELEIPGHGMAAIAAYPELSCKGEKGSPRIVWGIEDIVMCPGKDKMFEFLKDVIREMVPLFPSPYFHIGGDECPKNSWKHCPACQKRIADLHIQGDEKHPAEEKLQSYVVSRMEKFLAQYGKRIIGWDEILDGGLSEQSIVMSWRGIKSGIQAAMQKHDVIMTPSSDGLYLDYYQGDNKVEPVTITSSVFPLEKVYQYNPVPDKVKELGLEKYILGVQCNNWSEYMFSNAKMEYQMYPRAIAVSEIAWSPLNKKNFQDFCKRLDVNCVRLDERHFNYHIPLPEQPYGSCDKVAITQDTTVTFTTTRPMKMVYTLDGTTPTPSSTVYTAPIPVSNNCVINIATVLPFGKMSRVRSIQVERQQYAPAVQVADVKPGLQMKRIKGYYRNVNALDWADDAWETSVIKNFEGMKIKQTDDIHTLHGENAYAAVAEGYVNIPEDGVYYIASRTDQVWLDSKLIINNDGEIKTIPRHDNCVALAKGLHPIKFVFIGNITGGWPSWWHELNLQMRKDNTTKFKVVSSEQLFH